MAVTLLSSQSLPFSSLPTFFEFNAIDGAAFGATGLGIATGERSDFRQSEMSRGIASHRQHTTGGGAADEHGAEAMTSQGRPKLVFVRG